MSRTSLYNLRESDPDFSAAWDDAIEQGADALEDEAVRRALDSSDTLLIFLLKGARPEKYRERADVRHSGRLDIDWSRVPDDVLARYRAGELQLVDVQRELQRTEA